MPSREPQIEDLINQLTNQIFGPRSPAAASGQCPHHEYFLRAGAGLAGAGAACAGAGLFSLWLAAGGAALGK